MSQSSLSEAGVARWSVGNNNDENNGANVSSEHEVSLHDEQRSQRQSHSHSAAVAAAAVQPHGSRIRGDDMFDGPLWRKLPHAWRSSASDAAATTAIGDAIIPAAQLSTKALLKAMEDVEADAENDRREEQEARHREMLKEQVRMRLEQTSAAAAEEAFLAQEQFYYAVPPGSSDYVLPSFGIQTESNTRQRPVVQSTNVRAIPAVPSPTLPLDAQETKHAERLVELRLQCDAIKSYRDAAHFDAEELMFAPSSDDSDGYDEDYQEEWRDETNEIYSACRAVECNANDDEAYSTLGKLIDRLCDAQLTPSEQELLWDTLRYVHRNTQPIHSKTWLSSCSEILETESFASRPSVANWCYLLGKMKLVSCFSQRRRDKITSWYQRAVFIARKRLAVLREIGKKEPTWADLHVSVGGLNRDDKVPTMTLGDTLEALTAHTKAKASFSPTAVTGVS